MVERETVNDRALAILLLKQQPFQKTQKTQATTAHISIVVTSILRSLGTLRIFIVQVGFHYDLKACINKVSFAKEIIYLA